MSTPYIKAMNIVKIKTLMNIKCQTGCNKPQNSLEKEEKVMLSQRSLLLGAPYGYYDYIWVDVTLIKETKKALLIEFDGKKTWLPKAWIRKRSDRGRNVRGGAASSCERPSSIKISLYHWTKKFG